MAQLTVTFPQDTMKSLKAGAKKKDIAVSEYIRRLVLLGLRMENYQTEDEGDGFDLPGAIMRLEQIAKKQLTYTGESVLLSQGLIKQSSSDKASADKVIIKSREDAEKFVEGFMAGLSSQN